MRRFTFLDRPAVSEHGERLAGATRIRGFRPNDTVLVVGRTADGGIAAEEVYWNIAPQDDDVWDMRVFSHSTHVSEPERAAFRAIVDAGYADVVRPYTPGPGVYTYWDYTQLRFPRREGMRIDFVLGSPALQARVTNALIDREERKGKGASDHAPVVVELAD